MRNESVEFDVSRRDLLRMMGVTAGAATMYQAMKALGFAADLR